MTDNINNRSSFPESSDLIVNLIDPDEHHRLLFVDDEELILRSFKRDMAKSEMEITLAKSADEGMEALKNNKYALILCDYQMPGINGMHFLEKAHKISPDSVLILVSGKSNFSMAINAVNTINLFNFISKPWESHALSEIIRRALNHYLLNMENKRLNVLLSSKCTELTSLAHDLEKDVQLRTTSLLLGLVNALDLRDTETQTHSRRVALYSRRLAREIGITGNTLSEIERGALLHDLGKIGVSDTILLKPGKLTEEEYNEIKNHSEYGYRILEGIDFLENARLLVWQHHERWDGKGYPNGLSGMDVFIGARIFGIIDTYDAITSDRPYRKAATHEEACEEIIKMSGTQFDPQIVKAWQQIPKSDLLNLREKSTHEKAGLD